MNGLLAASRGGCRHARQLAPLTKSTSSELCVRALRCVLARRRPACMITARRRSRSFRRMRMQGPAGHAAGAQQLAHAPAPAARRAARQRAAGAAARPLMLRSCRPAVRRPTAAGAGAPRRRPPRRARACSHCQRTPWLMLARRACSMAAWMTRQRQHHRGRAGAASLRRRPGPRAAAPAQLRQEAVRRRRPRRPRPAARRARHARPGCKDDDDGISASVCACVSLLVWCRAWWAPGRLNA